MMVSRKAIKTFEPRSSTCPPLHPTVGGFLLGGQPARQRAGSGTDWNMNRRPPAGGVDGPHGRVLGVRHRERPQPVISVSFQCVLDTSGKAGFAPLMVLTLGRCGATRQIALAAPSPNSSDLPAALMRAMGGASSLDMIPASTCSAHGLLAWWLLAGSIAPHAFGRRHWSIAEAWASTPGFRNGGGFRNARWRFRNGLFRRRPDWTWRRLLLLTEQLLTRCPVQHPSSVH